METLLLEDIIMHMGENEPFKLRLCSSHIRPVFKSLDDFFEDKLSSEMLKRRVILIESKDGLLTIYIDF